MKKIIVSLLLFLPAILLSAQDTEEYNSRYRLYHNSYENGKVAVFNEDREEIIPYYRGYTSITRWEVEGRIGFYEVCNGKKHGVCDITGKEIIPCKYANVSFYDGHFYAFSGENKNKYTGRVDFDITLDCEGKAAIRQPLKKVNKELYNVLAKQYKIKKAYIENLGGSGTYICVVDKYNYKSLFDMSGKLLVKDFGTIYPIKPCEDHFDLEWIEATDGGLLVSANSASYLVSAKDKSVNKLPGGKDFRGGG